MLRAFSRSMVLLMVIGLVGCGSKLSYTDTVSIDSGETQIRMIDAPKSDQRVRVEFTSNNPVNVAVILSEQLDKSDQNLSGEQVPTGALGSEMNTKNGSFEVSIPAGKEFQILIGVSINGEAATVELKATSF